MDLMQKEDYPGDSCAIIPMAFLLAQLSQPQWCLYDQSGVNLRLLQSFVLPTPPQGCVHSPSLVAAGVGKT